MAITDIQRANFGVGAQLGDAQAQTSQISGGASLNQARPQTITERLSAIASRLSEIDNQLVEVGDNIYGAQPMATGSDAKAARDCITARIEDIESIVSRCETAATRIQRGV